MSMHIEDPKNKKSNMSANWNSIIVKIKHSKLKCNCIGKNILSHCNQK